MRRLYSYPTTTSPYRIIYFSFRMLVIRNHDILHNRANIEKSSFHT
uniref:Uncharacterized protein n=1 Tax=Arundo donax TaxID=35708 RepID=A0A0A9GT00_ARUDO